MHSKKEILHLLNLYNMQFPDETAGVQPFAEYMQRTADGQLITRTNFDGHITASAFIIDANASEILLLRHKSLGKWLQPGGHVEENDTSLPQAAIREATEETGIRAEELTHQVIGDTVAVPFDIDSHYIPPNPKKEEDGHYHHDMRYLFVYTGSRDNTYNEEESTGLRWVPFSELADDKIFAHVALKIRAHMPA